MRGGGFGRSLHFVKKEQGMPGSKMPHRGISAGLAGAHRGGHSMAELQQGFRNHGPMNGNGMMPGSSPPEEQSEFPASGPSEQGENE
jgi:hypothetical protein